MNIYLSRLDDLELLAFAAGLVSVALIILYLIVENKPRQIVTGRGGEQRFLPNTKDYIGRLVGMFGITALAVLASHWSVYILAVIVIATLVTDTDFLVRIVALIWDRKEYWEYETKVITTQQGQPEDPKVEKIADKVNQDPNGLTDLLNKKEKELSRALLNYHFERVYRQIFGSQLAILKTLQNSQPSQLSVDAVELLYKGTSWYPNYTFEQYLGFLEESFLVERRVMNSAEYIVLLPMGQAFLEYLGENAMPLEKQPF